MTSANFTVMRLVEFCKPVPFPSKFSVSLCLRGEHSFRVRLSERGHALITVLLIAAFLTPIGAFAVMQARLDLLTQHAVRAALEAFVAAESGLDHALADLDLDPSFDRLRGGPDGIAGTGDDGKFPFLHPPSSLVSPLPYDIAVTPLGPDAVEIVASGRSDAGSQRAVAARVARSPNPTLPGALVSASTDLTVSLGVNFLVDGADRGRERPRPALVFGNEVALERALASLPADAGTRLAGRGGAPSMSAAELGPTTSRIAAAAADSRAARVGPTGPVGDGLQVSTGSLSLAGDELGSGALLVQGDLEVTGHLTFSGLMFVSGDVRIASDANLQLAGSLVQGAAGRRLELLGSGGVVYDSGALADLEAKFPGVLPRGVTVIGWREIF